MDKQSAQGADAVPKAARLRTGFERVVAFHLALMIGLSLTAMVVVAMPARRQLQQDAARSRTRWCAVALSHADGNLEEAVRQLRATDNELLGIATIDTYGQIDSVYPDLPNLRAAAGKLAHQDGRIVEIHDPGAQRPIRLTGATQPLRRINPADPASALILLRHEPGSAWMLSMLYPTAGIMLVMALVARSAISRWLRRHVEKPLRHISDELIAGRKNLVECGANPKHHREVRVLWDHMNELLETARESEERAQRAIRDSTQELEKKHAGLAAQLRRAKDLANMDALTRLRNRKFMEDRLEILFRQHRAGKLDMAAIMFDLDNFKPYNDAHGHQHGDALLKFVGSLLQGGLRSTDHVVRYGGDEFLALLPETGLEEARALADRLIKLFGQYVKGLSQTNRLSFSAGVATIMHDTPATGHALVAKADAALYEAKRNGKNGVHTSAGMTVKNRP